MRRGVLLELAGACLVLFASHHAAIGWIKVYGHVVIPRSPSAAQAWPMCLLVGGLAAMVLGYALILRAISSRKQSQAPGLGLVLATTLLLALPLLLLPTIPSSDVYSYAMYGRIEALYGANPYTTPPSRYAKDPLMPLLGDRTVVSVYGPAWQTIARTIAALLGTGGDPALFVLIYKLLGLTALVLGSVCIWIILGRLAPDDRTLGTWLYAVNPLCLLELVGAGHNDGLMMLLVLLGVMAWIRGRIVLAVVGLGLAILIKWIMLLLIPAGIVWAFRQPGQRGKLALAGAAGTLLVLALAAGLYGRNWAGFQTFDAVTRGAAATKMSNSLAWWVANQIDPRRVSGAASSPSRQRAEQLLEARPTGAQRQPSTQATPSTIEQRLRNLSTLLFLTWASLLLPYARGPRPLLAVWGWTFLAYVCLAGVWFWPWYVIWILPFAALTPRSTLAKTTLLLSVTALTISIARAATAALGVDLDHAPLLVFLPPLGYGLVMLFLDRTGRARAKCVTVHQSGSRVG